MATEFDDGEHWGLFLTGSSLNSGSGKIVRQSSLTLAAMRAAGLLDNMVDGLVAPATDKLWLDKNSDPPVLREWDDIASAWEPVTFDRIFGRVSITALTVTGGTENAVEVDPPFLLLPNRLYSLVPASTSTGPATITVPDIGTFDVTYLDGTAIAPGELAEGKQVILLLGNGRFSVVVGYGGVALLDSNGLVQSSQLPVSGSYKGTWNANTNSPAIASGVGVNGDFYIVGTAGSTSIDGTSSWAVGDTVRFNGTVWQKIANTATVSSVAGKTGAVTIVAADVGGLGTAATRNTGTSGAAVPLLNGVNTWSGTQTIANSAPVLIFDDIDVPVQHVIGPSSGGQLFYINVDRDNEQAGSEARIRIDGTDYYHFRPDLLQLLGNTAIAFSGTGAATTANNLGLGGLRGVVLATPEAEGAVGNGVTDDTAAMAAWWVKVRAGAIGWLGANKNYLMTGSTMTSANESITIVGNGATITMATNSRHFLFDNTFETVVTPTGFSQISYDFGNGTPTLTTRVNMSSGNRALFAVGDIVKVAGDAIMPTEEVTQREAEFAQVGAIDGSGLILRKKIQFPVGANPMCGKLRTGVKIYIENLYINQTGFNDTTTWANERVVIRNAFQPTLVNVTSLNSASQVIKFSGCYQQQTFGLSINNARTYGAANAQGYGVVECHSEHGLHVNLKGFNCRHVFTTVAQETTAGDGNLMNRGRNKYARVINGQGSQCTNAAFDTHADSYGTEFIGCTVLYPYGGSSSGAQQNFQLRGINDRCVDCKSYGSATGYFINRHGNEASPLQAGYCSIINCEHVGDASDTTERPAVRIQGDAASGGNPDRPVTYAFVSGFRFQRNGSTAPLLRCYMADVTLVDPQLVGPNSTSGNCYDYMAGDGAIVRIRGGRSDHTGSHASASFRTFYSFEPGTEWDVDGYDITTLSGQFAAIVNAVNAAGGKEVTGWLRNIKTNVAPGSITIVGSQLTDSLWIDANGGPRVAFDSNRIDITYSTAGATPTLGLQRRGGDRVYVSATVSASGVEIADINPGAFAGQLLTIRVGGSQTLTILNGSNLAIGSSIALAPAAATTLLWSGTAWVRT